MLRVHHFVEDRNARSRLALAGATNQQPPAPATIADATNLPLLDTGAYADNGPRVTATGGDAAPGPYRWESFRVDAACVYTNTSPSGSYRAFGATHLQWIGERLGLQAGRPEERGGIDPDEARDLVEIGKNGCPNL